MPNRSATKAFETRWAPTEQEKLQRFGEIIVNTGTYNTANGQIEVRPIIARMPEFMGGRMVYRIEWSGDDLTLTFLDEYTFDGIQAPWVGKKNGKEHLTLSRLQDDDA
jgi:hypothetical protein